MRGGAALVFEGGPCLFVFWEGDGVKIFFFETKGGGGGGGCVLKPFFCFSLGLIPIHLQQSGFKPLGRFFFFSKFFSKF